MKAIFKELPPFERFRKDYLSDEQFLALQQLMLLDPEIGDVIKGSGGLRKMRLGDPRRSKGKRGGLRIIYYWWLSAELFLLFSIYGKDEMEDLSPKELALLATMLTREKERNAR